MPLPPGHPDDSYERAAGAADGRLVAGLDEVGRGAIAGPLMAAAVVVDMRRLGPDLRARIRDSKLLTARQRAALALELRACAEIALGQASAREVDRLNAGRATLRAMGRAVRALPRPPEAALVDGLGVPRLGCPVTPIVDGDCRSLSVAAASIVAKTERDRLMAELALRYPGYGWEHNMGYATADHLAALRLLGPTPQHRRSFAPVRLVLAGP